MLEEKKMNEEVLTPEDVKELAPLYDNVILALKQVYDPEMHISKSHEVSVTMTFTAPNCPMADEVLAEARASVEDVPGVKKCTIELSFDTPWDASMLSDEARLALGMDDWDTPAGRPDPGEGPDYSKAPNT